jgi:hypothetical protein
LELIKKDTPMNSESSESSEETIARLTARVFMLESLIDRILEEVKKIKLVVDGE